MFKALKVAKIKEKWCLNEFMKSEYLQMIWIISIKYQYQNERLKIQFNFYMTFRMFG